MNVECWCITVLLSVPYDMVSCAICLCSVAAAEDTSSHPENQHFSGKENCQETKFWAVQYFICGWLNYLMNAKYQPFLEFLKSLLVNRNCVKRAALLLPRRWVALSFKVCLSMSELDHNDHPDHLDHTEHSDHPDHPHHLDHQTTLTTWTTCATWPIPRFASSRR